MSSDSLSVLTSNSTIIGTIVVCITAILIFLQVKEMANARMMEALSSIFNSLTNEDMSRARRYVLNHKLPQPGLTSLEDYENMHKLWVAFDNLGIMIEYKLIPKEIALKMFSHTIISCWHILKPFIIHERKKRNAQYQMYFEKLYDDSINFRNKLGLTMPEIKDDSH